MKLEIRIVREVHLGRRDGADAEARGRLQKRAFGVNVDGGAHDLGAEPFGVDVAREALEHRGVAHEHEEAPLARGQCLFKREALIECRAFAAIEPAERDDLAEVRVTRRVTREEDDLAPGVASGALVDDRPEDGPHAARARCFEKDGRAVEVRLVSQCERLHPERDRAVDDRVDSRRAGE